MRQNDPLRLSHAAVQLFVDMAQAQHAMGARGISDHAVPMVPLTTLSSSELKQQFLAQLHKLRFTGQTTNLGAALEQGLQSFPASPTGYSRDLVLLLTDGQLDLGPARHAERTPDTGQRSARLSCQNTGVVGSLSIPSPLPRLQTGHCCKKWLRRQGVNFASPRGNHTA